MAGPISLQRPAVIRQNENQEILTAPDTFAITLLVLFLDRFGTEGLDWAPETVLLETEDEFKVALPQRNLDRLLAAIALVQSDAFYHSAPDFVQFCNVLSGDTFDASLWDPADIYEVAWGVTEAALIYPPQDPENPFSPEILGYIDYIMDMTGMIAPPKALDFMRRPNLAEFTQTNFADDPLMFSAVYESEQVKTSDVNSVVTDNLRRVSDQLLRLQLNDGDPKEFARTLQLFTQNAEG